MIDARPANRLVPIGYYIGLVIIGLGALHLIPMVTAVVYREWTILVDFTISFSLSILCGSLLALLCGKAARRQKLSWGEGMTVSAVSWIVGMILCAMPYYLSGQYLSFLDACFDVMSGFTTTGLVLIQDLDHTSNGINMWRHLLTFVGGQGMVVLALTFLVKGTNGAYKMYVGEGKDERLIAECRHHRPLYLGHQPDLPAAGHDGPDGYRPVRGTGAGPGLPARHVAVHVQLEHRRICADVAEYPLLSQHLV